jgi:hypothetical protein
MVSERKMDVFIMYTVRTEDNRAKIIPTGCVHYEYS